MNSLLSFPVPVSMLQDALPHRPPMLWIDEVLWVREGEGECRIFLKAEAHYFDAQGKIRPSSLIEWMAQGYGFIKACLILNDKRNEKAQKCEKTYLAAVSDLDFRSDALSCLEALQEVRVHTRIVRELGSLTSIQATVKAEEGILATGNLKIYVA